MIEIKIPFKTPTINHLYGQRGFRKYLKPEAKILRKEIKEIVNKICKKGFILKDTNKLDIEVKIYENWYTKKGEIKRKDISNREKFLIDSIFEALEIDDKGIFKHTMIKIQSDKEFSIIKIKEFK